MELYLFIYFDEETMRKKKMKEYMGIKENKPTKKEATKGKASSSCKVKPFE